MLRFTDDLEPFDIEFPEGIPDDLEYDSASVIRNGNVMQFTPRSSGFQIWISDETIVYRTPKKLDGTDAPYTVESGEEILLKYRADVPARSLLNLFTEDIGEVTRMEYNIPVPSTFDPMTFLQIYSTNGYQYQQELQGGSQTFNDMSQLLANRNARSADVLMWDTPYTLWFARLHVFTADGKRLDVAPTPGQGGATVTALPE